MRFPEDVPALTGSTVVLRAHRAGDLEAVVAACQDPEMQGWTTIPVPYRREHAVSYLTELVPAGWRDGSTYSWAIEVGDRYAGTIDLRDLQGGYGELGFVVAPWARGRGVMTEAVRLVVRYAFDRLGWQRVGWRAFVGNWASRRVAWKTGFRGLVTLPVSGLQRGVRRDEWFASVGRDDALEPQASWWTEPVVEGDGIRLRPFRADDDTRIVEASNDPSTQQWLARLPSPYDQAAAELYAALRKDQAATGQGLTWAVADADNDVLLGNVSLFDLANRLDPTCGQIGYWSHPDARGRGVISQAVGLAARHAFTPVDAGGLGVRRLVLYAAAGNTASIRVAETNGFTPTGRSRAADPRRDGTYDDLLTFDRLATDLPATDPAARRTAGP